MKPFLPKIFPCFPEEFYDKLDFPASFDAFLFQLSEEEQQAAEEEFWLLVQLVISKMDPGQQVASTAELIDKIYSYLDLKTVVQARIVCRQWRSVSDLYLKRRMRIRNWHERQGAQLSLALTVALYPHVQKSSNLLNNAFPVVEMRSKNMTLTPCNSKGSRKETWKKPEWKHSSAPLVAIVLDQDWTSTIDSLKLVLCLTLNDFQACQVAILKRFSSMRAFFAKLKQDQNAVVPLCYAEIQNQSGQEDFQNGSLKRFEIRGWLRCFKKRKAGSLDSLVYDLFAICPNLNTFKLGLFKLHDDDDHNNDVYPEYFFPWDMWAEGDGIKTDIDLTITRSANPKDINSSAINPYWTARIIVSDRKMGLALSSLMNAILSLTQYRKLWISLKFSALEKLHLKTNWLQDRLEVLYLTGRYFCPFVWKAMESTTVFSNVARLYLSALDLDHMTFHLNFTAGGSPVFPNVVVLQLFRERCGNFVEPEQGFDSDIWVLRNMHKMAPSVRRFIVTTFVDDEFAPRDDKRRYKFRGDVQRALEMAKSFGRLEELVLVNVNGANGGYWSDLVDERVVAALNGLKSLTLSVNGYKMLMEFAKYFLKVCQQESLASITKIGLYNRDEDDYFEDDSESENEEDGGDVLIGKLRRSGVAIPERINVTTGTWTREMAMEAFEGPLM